MKTTTITGLALLLAVSCASPGSTRRPNTIVNISPAVNQRIIVSYGNEQHDTTTFTAMVAAEEGEWFVEGTDGTPIDLPASAAAFEITGGDSPVVSLGGKKVKIFAHEKDVLATKRHTIGSDVPQKDKFYLVINYMKSVITIEVNQKV